MNSSIEQHSSILFSTLLRLACLQHKPMDKLALKDAVIVAEQKSSKHSKQITVLLKQLRLPKEQYLTHPDESKLPLLISDGKDWKILLARNGQGQWLSELWDQENQKWYESAIILDSSWTFFDIDLTPPTSVSKNQITQIIINEILRQKSILLELFVGGLLIALLGLLISFYSMQVYNKVIPSGAFQTLLVLTSGVFIGVIFELITRLTRNSLYEKLIHEVDSQLSRTVYLRFLSIRLDQLPQGVGSLSSKLRSYEVVRSFFAQLFTSFLIDIQFSFIYFLVILLIGGKLALIPFLFLIISICIGLWHKRVIIEQTQKTQEAVNHKTGILVETIEGAETIKSGQAGWRMLKQWLQSSQDFQSSDSKTRKITSSAQYKISSLQQMSYIGIVALGATYVYSGKLSFGGLLACSILSGRILGPISQIGTQLTQWGNVKAALQSLNDIWKLENDHSGIDSPIIPDTIQGYYQAENIQYIFRNRKVLHIPQMTIKNGEKIALLGTIGSGKTTLLRVLSGMYKPQQGRLLLDGFDIAHIFKPRLVESLGYLSQDTRLFSGTLRDNLLLGLTDPGDSAILGIAQKTNLFETVIKTHPEGLEQKIFEGGSGLSCGQKQLVNLTRLFLGNPHMWLLDEPTASLDHSMTLKIHEAFKSILGINDTLVLVTHKPELLSLVNRIIVLNSGHIVLDGPRDQILSELRNKSK